jgi:heme-degrading monooxygenase HmoA
MHFRLNEVEQFKTVFEANKEAIRKFPGNNHLQLLQDEKEAAIFFTYSIWDNEAALNAYRDSALFKQTWAKTKPLFEKPAEAWSTKRLSLQE